MSDEFQFNAGDTFYIECQYMDDKYNPLDLTGYTIVAKVATSADLDVYTLEVEYADTPLGKFILYAPASDTDDWPRGSLIIELKYVIDDIEASVNSVRFRCVKRRK